MTLAARLGGTLAMRRPSARLPAPARAHHSYGATYDTSREVRLDGKLVQFVFRNPHSFVHVQAPDESGASQRWAVEWSGTAQLANNGITRDTLRGRRRRRHRRAALAGAGRIPRADGEPQAAGRRLQLGHPRRRSGGLTGRQWSTPPCRFGSQPSLAIGAALLTVPVSAQRGGAGRGGPPPTPRAAAAMDLTGYWVSVITEDWKFRMVTPKKGVYETLTLNAEGRRIGDTWDPARDEAAGEQCRGYGAANIMRLPGRLRIAWADDTTLRIETDAGTQTRLLPLRRGSGGAGRADLAGHVVSRVGVCRRPRAAPTAAAA